VALERHRTLNQGLLPPGHAVRVHGGPTADASRINSLVKNGPVENDELKPEGAGSMPNTPGSSREDYLVSLRPDFSLYRKFAVQSNAVVAAWGLLVLAWIVRAFLGGFSEGWIVLGGGLLVLGLFGLYLVLYFHNARIFGTEDYFGRVGAFGRKRVWPRGTLHRVLICRLDTRYGPRRRCFFISNEGRLLVDVLADAIDVDQARALANLLGATFSERQDVMTRRRFLEEYPSALPWIVRHPVFSGLLAAVAGVALMVLVVVALERH